MSERWSFTKGDQKDHIVLIDSHWARTLKSYQEILTHNGAPNMIEYAKTNLKTDLCIVDAGCACGVALMQMREKFSQSRRIGIDLGNSPLLKLSGGDGKEPASVGDLFYQYGVTFFQDTYLNINKLIPEGYDLLFCVGAYFGKEHQGPEVFEGLRRFWEGLRPNGMAQIFLDIFPETLARTKAALKKAGIKYQVDEADLQQIKKHFGLIMNNATTGTLTLGPK